MSACVNVAARRLSASSLMRRNTAVREIMGSWCAGDRLTSTRWYNHRMAGFASCRRPSLSIAGFRGSSGTGSVQSNPNDSSNSALPQRRSFASGKDSSIKDNNNNDNGDNGRPFRILGVQQIAIGSDDRRALNHLWKDILGLQPHKTDIRMEKENVIEDSVRVGMMEALSQVEIDLMTPIDVEAHPRVHTKPLHHVGLWVDHLADAVEWMSARGVRFTPGGIRQGAAGHDICFIHPKGSDRHPVSGNGVLIELVQAPADLVEAVNAKNAEAAK